jgi:cell division protein FtsQ
MTQRDDRQGGARGTLAPPRRRTAPDRRIAERRREVVRQRVRRRRRQLAWSVVAVLAVLGGSKLVGSPLFGLSAVQVRGTSVLTAGEVVAASGLHPGQPYLSVDPAAVRRRVEALPRVGHAEVHRVYPSSLRITVAERKPAASIAAGGRFWMVAADGTVLDPSGTRPAGLPFVDHVPVPDGLRPGVHLPEGGPLANALTALGGLRPELAKLVMGVEAPSVDSLQFRMHGGLRVLYGLADEQPAKDAAVILIANRLRREGRQVVLIDVRNPSTPTVLGKRRVNG